MVNHYNTRIESITKYHNDIVITYVDWKGYLQEIFTENFEIEDGLWVSEINIIDYLIRIFETDEGFDFKIKKIIKK